MKKYSILIVGIRCYSGHIREFIVNLKKKNPQVDISLITTNIQDEYKEDIERCTSRIYMVKRIKHGGTFYALLNILYLKWSFLKLRLSNKHFDIADIHFPKGILKHVMPSIKKLTNNIVITPWGSDVMRVESEKSIKDLTNIYSQAKYVTIGTSSAIGKCAIAKFKVNPEKMHKLGWGGEFFDFIQENSSHVTIEMAKARFGLDGRFVITCGYNMQQEQRHEDMINAVYNIKEQLPNNFLLLFPFTYARNEKHIKQKEIVIEKYNSLGLDFIVIEEHLDLTDLLKLRMATDMFIHIQDTDAGSRCVMEYVLCNKKIVHGNWIKYKYLEEYKPSCYFPVDKLENLGAVIAKASQAKVDELPQEVRNIILDRGWSNRMTQWNDFFESIVS